MAILNNNPLVGASGNQGGYNINNSLRFRGSASAYLSRTPSSAGNRKTWTWSAWIKLGTISVNMGTLFIAQGQTAIYLNDGTNSSFRVNGAAGSDLITSLMPRDPSAWYHLVVACDTTQATDTNRLKIYVNGVQQTAFQAGSAYPTLNGDTFVNSTAAHYIGRRVWNGDQQYDGYIAEQYLIDGSQKAASDFGETDTTTGVWKPKAYSGTYGTNGFYLKFSDIATTSGSNAGLGKDFSGNSNYWTTNNISVTSGTTYDAMTDSPTNTSATVANYATFNPLSKTSSNATFSNANLTVTHSNNLTVDTTIGVQTGKYYCELTVSTISTRIEFGVAKDLNWAVNYRSDGQKNVNGTVSAYGATWTTGDVIGIAFDIASATATFYKNNVSQGQITGITYYSDLNFITTYGSTVPVYSLNFGQRPFAYTPPTGYVALNTYNLPTPTILQGNKYMDATLYTGNGATRSITNNGSFKPDFVWIKARSIAYFHRLADSVRGTGKELYSNDTGAETTNQADGYVSAFNSNGFSILGGAGVNLNANTFVAWQWQAGQGTNTTNTAGSITSTVSVNTTAGFSIATFTLPASGTFTVGHGLGVAPAMMILKCRGTAGTNWVIYHQSLGNTKWISLNLTNAATTDTTWNNTSPTSTVFTGNTVYLGSSLTYVAYCFAEIAGFSKFGSYTGNGSADGPFVFTNLKARFIMIKRTDSTSNWTILDTAREGYNVDNDPLYPNLSDAEGTTDLADILSNGFKLRSTDTSVNANAGTYIYACFSSNPFKNSTAV